MADDRRGGPGYRYEYEYHAGQYEYGKGAPRPPQPPKKPGGDGWAEWVWMGVLFLIPSWITKIIAVVWFLNRFNALSKAQKDACRDEAKQAARQAKDAVTGAARDIAREFRSGQAQPRPGQPQTGPAQTARTAQAAPAEPRRRAAFDRRSAQKRAQGAAAAGTGLMIGGGVMAGLFGIASISVLDEVIRAFSFEDLAGLLLLLALAAGGIGMLLAGLGKRRRAERYVSYLGYIGANREISLAHMASSFGVSVEKLCKDLRYMLAKGILPVGYLDLAEGRLFLTEAGYRQPEPAKAPPKGEAASRARQQEEEDSLLRQIRQVNDDIPDAAMSAKIDRIEEITGKILAYQKAHPDREAQLRSFLNYYLPTTLKILRAYAQLDAQGVEGENITAAKARIEGMMDQVVAGFERQLDKLFQDDAMDIASDVEVLENMLKKDGLSDDGMTMPM